MKKIFLSLSSNLGDKKANIENACVLLEKNDIKIIKKSALYETEPWGEEEQPWFLNQVVEVATILHPQDLLEKTQDIEKELGRKKRKKWTEREIDIDILFYGKEILHKENLTIPHPFIEDRKFILVPLNEIASDFIHPILKKSMKELLHECNDLLQVEKGIN